VPRLAPHIFEDFVSVLIEVDFIDQYLSKAYLNRANRFDILKVMSN